MLLTSFYYQLKPYIPSRVRLGLRRFWARRTWRNSQEIWPISESAAKKPEGWPGWPDGKQFAFVIMHDVETQAGADKCRALLDLEESLGFRSAFNFIPEGGYEVPATLRKEIVERGCEVGVHDLHHDGKLYNSRKGFAQKALRINQYLRDWDAVGFRSGFMLNNLEWLHDLDISYDASTFDTDPFEPQPEGRNTIFPFWVTRPDSATDSEHSTLQSKAARGSAGYVELPYTLAQDSTLFLVLGETNSTLWFQKLRWLAKNGGMAMIGVHPDYIALGNTPQNEFTYPEQRYKEFLLWLRQEYKGAYWNPTPRELASYFVETLKGKGRNCIAKLLVLGSVLTTLGSEVSEVLL